MTRQLFIGLVLAVASLSAEPTQWKIDTSHSAAQFSVKHLMVSTVRGHFGTLTGTVTYDPAKPAATVVDAEVDVTTIDTRNERRDKHLRSADFFDVEKFPKMTFKSKSVRTVAPGKMVMVGDLTLRGTTKEVTFEVEGPSAPLNTGRVVKMGAVATAKINRSDFGMTWNRAIEAGGVTVGDEVTLTIDLELDQVK
jgi:polyisoprenoid-binding protein YceI